MSLGPTENVVSRSQLDYSVTVRIRDRSEVLSEEIRGILSLECPLLTDDILNLLGLPK